MDHMVKLYLALWENSKLFSKWLFFHNNPFCGPCMAWLIASLSYASVFTTAKLWSMKGIKKKKAKLDESQVESGLLGEISTTSDMQMIPL